MALGIFDDIGHNRRGDYRQELTKLRSKTGSAHEWSLIVAVEEMKGTIMGLKKKKKTKRTAVLGLCL